jgi:hypothetical protein
MRILMTCSSRKDYLRKMNLRSFLKDISEIIRVKGMRDMDYLTKYL